MRSFKMFLIVFVAAAVFATALPASAYIINYGADGVKGGGDDTPLFYDSFETQPTDPVDKVSHAAYPNEMDAFPAGTVLYGGYWALIATPDYWARFQVTDHKDTDATPAGFDPGAYEGKNYMRIMRETGQSFVEPQMHLPTTQTSGTLHLEQMVYISNASLNGNGFGLSAKDEAGNQVFLIKATNNGEVTARRPNNTYGIISDVSWTRYSWQKWEIDYTIGDEYLTLKIDGATNIQVPVFDSSVNVKYFIFNTGGTTTSPIYIDEVPEPSTLALLATGLIGLLAYAWRKRK